jgi:GTP-binding protein EngB required for normal cell division
VSRRRPDDGLALDERLEALATAVAAGDGVVPEPDLRAARALVARAGERLGHGVGHTVVALAGATGSGKSSLFNALVGVDLSTVGVRRPTTSTTHAASWGDDATPLLDWLGVDRRHHVADVTDLGGLVLLDLPDHDSTALEHRREVDRVVAVADMVVWVLDPQKYADGAVHERYLRPLARHAGVLLVVLNQVDRLTAEQLEACRRDLAQLLVDDGLVDVQPLTSSVRLPGGTDELRSALAERVQARRAAVERLSADVAAITAGLGRACAEGHAGGVGGADRRRVVDALVEAAGVRTVTAAVAGSHRAQAVAATGWPATRWLRRLRPDPLRRLHLGAGAGTPGRTSLPAPDAVSVARVDTALRSLGDGVTPDLPLPWADEVRREAGQRAERLPERLDAAVAGTDLGVDRRPRWWAPVGVLQVALIVTAVVGALWLAALAAWPTCSSTTSPPRTPARCRCPPRCSSAASSPASWSPSSPASPRAWARAAGPAGPRDASSSPSRRWPRSRCSSRWPASSSATSASARPSPPAPARRAAGGGAADRHPPASTASGAPPPRPRRSVPTAGVTAADRAGPQVRSQRRR